MLTVSEKSFCEERNVIEYLFNIRLLNNEDECNNLIDDSSNLMMVYIREILSKEICKMYDLDYKDVLVQKAIESEVDFICKMIKEHSIISSLYTACNMNDNRVAVYEYCKRIDGGEEIRNNYAYTGCRKRIFSDEETYVNRLLQYLCIKNITEDCERNKKYYGGYENEVNYYFKLKYEYEKQERMKKLDSKKKKNKEKPEEKYSVSRHEGSIYYFTLKNANKFCGKSIQRLIDSQFYSMARTVNENLIVFAKRVIDDYVKYGFIEKTKNNKIDKLLAIYEFERYYNINYLQNIATNIIKSTIKENEFQIHLPLYDAGRLLPNVFSRNSLVNMMNELYYIRGEESRDHIEEFLIRLNCFVFPLAEKIFFLNLYNCIKRKKSDGEFKEIVKEMKSVLIDFIEDEKEFNKISSEYLKNFTEKSIYERMYGDALKNELENQKAKKFVAKEYSDAIKFLYQSKVQEQESSDASWIEGYEKICKKNAQIQEMDRMFNRTFSREYFCGYEFYNDIIEAAEKKLVKDNKS